MLGEGIYILWFVVVVGGRWRRDINCIVSMLFLITDNHSL